MVRIKRDKSLSKYSSTDFVKYFVRRYNQINKAAFDVNYARDCVIMSSIMHKFEKVGKPKNEIIKFIDYAFDIYDKRMRAETIDFRFLSTMANIFLKSNTVKNTKVKTPETILSEDIKQWLLEEKEKWIKP